MATAPANGAPAFVDPGDIFPLDPNDIVLGERLRPIDEAWATAIGQSMKRDGQIHAVDVRRVGGDAWELAGAGGHRVTGARLAGIPIDVRVVNFDEAFARRREAAENLFRRANDPLERAEAIAELVRLLREKSGIEEADRRDMRAPKRLREEAAGHMEIISMSYGWSEEIGEQIGLTGRTVRNDLFLYRGIKPSVVALLREKRHPILKNASQLRALAKLEPAEQGFVARQLATGMAKTAGEAIRRSRGSNSVARSAEEKRLATVLGTLKRMSHAELVGLCQSPSFQDLLSKDARDLLKPIRREGAGL